MVARQAHNLKVIGSNPIPASTFLSRAICAAFLFSGIGVEQMFRSQTHFTRQSKAYWLSPIAATFGNVKNSSQKLRSKLLGSINAKAFTRRASFLLFRKRRQSALPMCLCLLIKAFYIADSGSK